ncbi:MAG: hypothetical protein ACREJ3_09585 [Polyangiaceae bacterium]
MAIVPIVASRRAGGQLPGMGGLDRIRRILVPVYSDGGANSCASKLCIDPVFDWVQIQPGRQSIVGLQT